MNSACLPEDEVFVCYECKNEYSTEDEVKQHIINFHKSKSCFRCLDPELDPEDEIEVFTCHGCLKEFLFLDEIKQHVIKCKKLKPTKKMKEGFLNLLNLKVTKIK